MNGFVYRRKGRKKWNVIVDFGRDSTGERKKTWYSGYRTKKEAQEALNEILYKLQINQYIMPTNITFGDFLHYWLEHYGSQNLEITTIESYRSPIDVHIIPALGDIKLQALKPMRLQAYYNKKCEELSSRSVIYHHRIIRKALDYAYRLEMIPRNVADQVTIPRAEKYQAQVYDLVQVKKLFEELQGSRYELAVHLLVILGLRRGELLGLQWKDIDWEKQTVTISRALVKAGKQKILKSPKTASSYRRLSLSTGLIDRLKLEIEKQAIAKETLGQYYMDGDFIIAHEDGTPANPDTFTRWFIEFLKRKGLPKIRLHDLRHTNATLMLSNNIPSKIASTRLGHSNIQITLDTYTHVLQENEKEAADMFENILYNDR